MQQDLTAFERIYFKTLVLESIKDFKLDSSSYTIYFNSNYYSTYSLLSCFKIILDSVSMNEPTPKWWYEINKSIEVLSLYEFFLNDDSEQDVHKFINKLVYYNTRIHYYLANLPEGDYESQLRLINKRMNTVVTSTENTLDALLK